jgi:hypothetical protein
MPRPGRRFDAVPVSFSLDAIAALPAGQVRFAGLGRAIGAVELKMPAFAGPAGADCARAAAGAKTETPWAAAGGGVKAAP